MFSTNKHQVCFNHSFLLCLLSDNAIENHEITQKLYSVSSHNNKISIYIKRISHFIQYYNLCFFYFVLHIYYTIDI